MRHDHAEGGFVGAHDHIGGEGDHTHGPPGGDGGYWGENRGPIRPTSKLWAEASREDPLLSELFAPPIYVPYVPGMLAVETASALNFANRLWWKVDVSGTDWDYWSLLSQLWARGEDFTIVEHDNIPRPDFADELDACPEVWCGFSYPVTLPTGQVVSVAEWGAPPHATALGCVRFRRALLEAEPDAVESMGDKTWRRLDYSLVLLLMSRGYRCHRHFPDIGHAHRYDHPAHAMNGAGWVPEGPT